MISRRSTSWRHASIAAVAAIVLASCGDGAGGADGDPDAGGPGSSEGADGTDATGPSDPVDDGSPGEATCGALDAVITAAETHRRDVWDDEATFVDAVTPVLAAQEALADSLGEDAAAALEEGWIAPTRDVVASLEESGGHPPELPTSDDVNAYHRENPWINGVLRAPLVPGAAFDEVDDCGTSLAPETSIVAATSAAVEPTTDLPVAAIADYTLAATSAVLFEALHPCTAVDDAVAEREPDLQADRFRTVGSWFTHLSVACVAVTGDGTRAWLALEIVSPEHHAAHWGDATPTDAVPGGLEQDVDEIEYDEFDDGETGPGPWRALASYDPASGARVTAFVPDGVDAVALIEAVTELAEAGFDEARHDRAIESGGDDDSGDGTGSVADDPAARTAWEGEPCASYSGRHGFVDGDEVVVFNDPTSCLAGMVEHGLLSPQEFAEQVG